MKKGTYYILGFGLALSFIWFFFGVLGECHIAIIEFFSGDGGSINYLKWQDRFLNKIGREGDAIIYIYLNIFFFSVFILHHIFLNKLNPLNKSFNKYYIAHFAWKIFIVTFLLYIGS